MPVYSHWICYRWLWRWASCTMRN